MGINSISEDLHEKRIKKAAIVILITLKREAKNKSSKESETEIRKTIEQALARIPYVTVDNVTIVKE